jgi:hypothetical protein
VARGYDEILIQFRQRIHLQFRHKPVEAHHGLYFGRSRFTSDNASSTDSGGVTYSVIPFDACQPCYRIERNLNPKS